MENVKNYQIAEEFQQKTIISSFTKKLEEKVINAVVEEKVIDKIDYYINAVNEKNNG